MEVSNKPKSQNHNSGSEFPIILQAAVADPGIDVLFECKIDKPSTELEGRLRMVLMHSSPMDDDAAADFCAQAESEAAARVIAELKKQYPNGVSGTIYGVPYHHSPEGRRYTIH